ncbi:hypothetical protein [Streptomyces sp. NPDC014676]|uniref:hypothetical protein n=1 Tax=Streptomyces sp. NPDC014676 TaxID=3364879 RepID=UPI003702E91E
MGRHGVAEGRRPVDQRSVRIGGSDCPRALRDEYHTYDLGPGDRCVSTSTSAVRDAFRAVPNR